MSLRTISGGFIVVDLFTKSGFRNTSAVFAYAKAGFKMPSIPELVWKVLAAFQSLENIVGAHEPTAARAVRSHWSRFKLWAGSVGAHRPYGHRSLEHRLSGALIIRNHVVGLLQDMCEHLEEGKS